MFEQKQIFITFVNRVLYIISRTLRPTTRYKITPDKRHNKYLTKLNHIGQGSMKHQKSSKGLYYLSQLKLTGE